MIKAEVAPYYQDSLYGQRYLHMEDNASANPDPEGVLVGVQGDPIMVAHHPVKELYFQFGSIQLRMGYEDWDDMVAKVITLRHVARANWERIQAEAAKVADSV